MGGMSTGILLFRLASIDGCGRFIQKQGLDRTFVECDDHMWRVGTRPLPEHVTIDGGSDWIVINRRYSHYLVTGEDDLLVRVKRIFEFSLLPAEVCCCGDPLSMMQIQILYWEASSISTAM